MESDSNECIFCRIVAGEISAEKLYEDSEVMAILDIKPNNPGHTLVIPKRHYKNILDLPQPVWLEMMKGVHTLAPVIKKSMNAGGINITMNNEAAANQLIFHAHVHVIPRHEGDPHRPWEGLPYKEGGIKETAEIIRQGLN